MKDLLKQLKLFCLVGKLLITFFSLDKIEKICQFFKRVQTFADPKVNYKPIPWS